MKQRMASADVAGEVSCLKEKVVGMRLANLYDLNAKVGQLLDTIMNRLITPCTGKTIDRRAARGRLQAAAADAVAVAHLL